MKPAVMRVGACRTCEWAARLSDKKVPADTPEGARKSLVFCVLTGDIMDAGDDCDEYEPCKPDVHP